MWRWFFFPIMVMTLCGFAGGAGLLTVVVGSVYLGDDSNLKKSTILARINEETSIYFEDEETRIGSFFEENHRRYVPIEEIPAHMLNAIIAAEDKNFYTHSGVDVVALAKAFWDGVQQGRFRRGASTITQQTVKNIMGRWERSFKRKFTEIISSLQLERLYSKRQILEFYLNQFHVAGNGNGIGIAARYYFNKDVRDLDLVEAAFIAGSVKAPSKYNPFIKYTQEKRDKARQAALVRKNYVLWRMAEQGWIEREEYEQAKPLPVPFNRGEFRTEQVSLVEVVRRELVKPDILETVGLADAEDLNQAGLRIYTTLNEEMQNAAQLAMQRNLSRLETMLEDYQPSDPKNFKALRFLEPGKFYYGQIESIERDPKKAGITVSFGLPKGTIAAKDLNQFATYMDRPKRTGRAKQLNLLLKTLKPGDIVYTEVLSYDRSQHTAELRLSTRPNINGGLIVIDQGDIKAVVGGFDKIGFNRAISAKRPPGSVFKSVAFFGALQLGWSMMDRLDNERQVFPYQGDLYFPRPDHASAYRDVAMIWAGIKSENLASVALVARLLEKLNFEQFKALLERMELTPEPKESVRAYRRRLGRTIGVGFSQRGVREQQLQNSLEEVTTDLIFQGQQRLLSRVRKIWMGQGYVGHLQALMETEPEEYSRRELGIRIDLTMNNFSRFQQLGDQMLEDWNLLQSVAQSEGPERLLIDTDLAERLERFRVLPTNSSLPELGYKAVLPEEQALTELERYAELMRAARPVRGRKLNALDIEAIFGGAGAFSDQPLVAPPDVRLAGYMPYRLIQTLGQGMDRRVAQVRQNQDRYGLYSLFQHHDFRIGLGLHYLVALTKAMGVESRVEPVLSFPLGTNDLSVGEVAKIYQSFVSGKIYRFSSSADSPPNQLNVIKRIEDRFGNVLYTPERQESLLVRRELTLQMREILRKVFTNGSGFYSQDALSVDIPVEQLGVEVPEKMQKTLRKDGIESKVFPVRVPAFGKTGTTNDFTTSYFAGFLPYPTENGDPLDPENSYVISSYVGYDLNRTMRNGALRVYGSIGALPLWADVGKSIIESRRYVDYIDTLDLSLLTRRSWPLSEDPLTQKVYVDLARGLVIRSGAGVNENEEAITSNDPTLRPNEFSLGSSVRAMLQVPTERSQPGWQPLRMVEPFHLEALPDPSQFNPTKGASTGRNERNHQQGQIRATQERPLPAATASDYTEEGL